MATETYLADLHLLPVLAKSGTGREDAAIRPMGPSARESRPNEQSVGGSERRVRLDGGSAAKLGPVDGHRWCQVGLRPLVNADPATRRTVTPPLDTVHTDPIYTSN